MVFPAGQTCWSAFILNVSNNKTPCVRKQNSASMLFPEGRQSVSDRFRLTCRETFWIFFFLFYLSKVISNERKPNPVWGQRSAEVGGQRQVRHRQQSPRKHFLHLLVPCWAIWVTSCEGLPGWVSGQRTEVPLWLPNKCHISEFLNFSSNFPNVDFCASVKTSRQTQNSDSHLMETTIVTSSPLHKVVPVLPANHQLP